MVATAGRRLFSSTCIEEMRNSSSRQVRLAQDNSFAQGGINFRLNLHPRRLTHHLVKAPYSVYRNRHLYIFIRSQISTKSTVFTDSANTGSAGAERFRVKSYVPPALSNGLWLGAIGLPVWTRNRRVCLFFFSFCPHGFCSRLEATVF
jgi:hypothetical protein